MNELKEILNFEQKKLFEIKKLKEKMREEIVREKERFLKLLQDFELQDEEKRSFVFEKEKKMKEISEYFENQINQKLKKLEEKKEKNMKEAINFLLEQILKI